MNKKDVILKFLKERCGFATEKEFNDYMCDDRIGLGYDINKERDREMMKELIITITDKILHYEIGKDLNAILYLSPKIGRHVILHGTVFLKGKTLDTIMDKVQEWEDEIEEIEARVQEKK